MTTTNDLLSLSSLTQMKLIGGGAGLNRTVTWPYVILCPPINEWVSGGEFLIYYGANAEVEKIQLQQLVREAAENDCSGILFLVGEHYILEKNLDDNLKQLADELSIPVFSITSRAYVNSITKDIIDLIQNRDKKLLENAGFWYSLFFEYTDTSQRSTMNKALFLGYMPNSLYRVYIVQFMNADEYFQHLASLHDSHFLESRSDFFRMLASKIDYMTHRELGTGWHIAQSDSSIFVFPVNTPVQEAAIDQYITNLCVRLETQFPHTKFLAGKGMAGSKLSEIQRSFIHAKRCLLAVPLLSSHNRLISYNELGFYQLLYEIPDSEHPRQYASVMLEPLIRHDRENDSRLMETLSVFFQCRCNKVQTANELYLHRNTLLSRLEKIENILNVSLDDSDMLFNLQTALRIHRFFTEL